MKLIYTCFLLFFAVKPVKSQPDALPGTLAKGKNISALTRSRSNAPLASECPVNIGFELGSFDNWKCYTGATQSTGNTNVINVQPSAPVTNRHTLVTRAAVSGTDPYGLFPINPPDGSGYAVKLGNDVNGAQAERITYQFTVPSNATDVSITYRYAVVFQDPGHLPTEQPRFIARMLDVQTNTYLPCASNEYIATAALPGFSTSTVDNSVKYKPWSSVFINLSAYAGKTLILEFTTADCTRGAHWGYAYIDVGDCNVSAHGRYDCNPNIASFTGPPGFQQYAWWDGNFSTQLGAGENLVLNPAPAIHTVNVIVTPYNGFGCSDTLQVSIYPILPVANAGPDTITCPGRAVTIGSAAANGFTYSWSPASFLSNPSVASPVCTAPGLSTYVVTVTSTESTCIDRDTVTVRVFQPVQVAVSPGQSICEGQTVTLQASGTAASYVWSPAQSLNRSDITAPIAYPKTTTTYQVVGYDGHQCFTDTGFIKVIVNPLPTIELGPDLVLQTGSQHAFSPVTQNSNGVSWQWSPPDNLTCTTCPAPTARVQRNITYYATIKNEYGCMATDSVHIKTFCEGSQVFIPNAFTPDGDGLNDILMVRGKGIALVRSFRIFSRWGELVFEKTNFQPNDPSFGWDGKIKGVTGPAEVYVYMADVVCENDLVYTYKGNVTLLK